MNVELSQAITPVDVSDKQQQHDTSFFSHRITLRSTSSSSPLAPQRNIQIWIICLIKQLSLLGLSGDGTIRIVMPTALRLFTTIRPVTHLEFTQLQCSVNESNARELLIFMRISLVFL